MRRSSIVLALLLVLASLGTVACTNPTAPAPAGDDVSNTKI